MREPILVFNAGSSSVKFSVFETGADRTPSVGAHGQVEAIGASARLEIVDAHGGKLLEEPIAATDHTAAIAAIHSWFAAHLGGEAGFNGVGHRVVHGGPIRAIGQGRVNRTYDRDEVMTLADRIGVMRAGKIEDRLADNDLFGSSCSTTSTASSVDFFVWPLLNLVQVAPVPPPRTYHRRGLGPVRAKEDATAMTAIHQVLGGGKNWLWNRFVQSAQEAMGQE